MTTLGGSPHYDPGDGSSGAVRIVNRDGSAISAGGGGGTSATDDAAFTVGASSVTPIGGLADETLPDSVDEGDVGAVRMTLARGLHVNIRDDAGDSAMDGANNALRVNIVAGATVTQYTEDAAAAADPVGDALILRRKDTLSVTEVSADGDNIAAQATAKGELYVKHTDAVPVTDNSGSLTVDAPVGTPAFVRLSDGAAAITALPVTDNGGLLSVDDGAGSLTVDAPVGTPAFVRLSDGVAAIATLPVSLASVPSHAVTNAGTFAVQVDGSALTSLQLIDDAVYAEDVAAQAADKGLAVLAVRRDANTSLVGTDNDYANLQVDATGSLKVAIISGAGSGGTAAQDNAAFTPGTTNFTPIGGEVDDVASTDATENSAAAVRMTTKRALHVNLRDATGAELSVGGGTQYDEDTVSTAADKVTMAGVVRKDAAATLVDTDGDRTQLQVDASGRLHTNGSGVTQPISAASLPLPAGAATLAKQPALGTAGTPAADVISVQGLSGMTPLREIGDVVAAVTAAWTSATAQDTAISVTVTGYGTVVLSLNPTSTFTGGVLTFELSDDAGTTWYPLQGVRADSFTSETTYTIVASTKRSWQFDAAGYTTCRVRLSTAITGTGTANLRLQASAVASEPSVVVGGTVTANVGTGPWPVTDNSGSLTVDAPVGTPVFVRLSDGAAAITALPVTDNGGALTVDNGGTFAVQATIASGAAAIAKAEDVPSADADVGVPAMAVRKAAPANTSGTDGDYEMLQMAAGRLWVDPSGVTLTVASHAVTNAGTFAVQDSEKLADDAAFTVATTKLTPIGYLADETATDSVDEGDIGAARITLDRKQIVTLEPHTKGGCSIFRSLDIDETEEDVKTSAGQVYAIHCMNLTNALLYLKFYNATAANTTVGSTTPVLTLPVAGNNDTDGAGFVLEVAAGINFDTAICVAATTGVADADTGAPAVNACVVNVLYA